MSTFFDLAKRLYAVESKLFNYLEQYNTGIIHGPNLWILQDNILQAEAEKLEIIAALENEIPQDAARSREIIEIVTEHKAIEAAKEKEAAEKEAAEKEAASRDPAIRRLF